MHRKFAKIISLLIVWLFATSVCALTALPIPHSGLLPAPRYTTNWRPIGSHLHMSHVALKNFIHPFQPYTLLPHLHSLYHPAQIISLKDAILLALRFSPTVIDSELGRVTQKYALIEARNQYELQYTLSGGTTLTKGAMKPIYNVDAGVSVETPIGTKISVGYTNPLDGSIGTATLDVKQPLIRGFGRVSEFGYLNAVDTEESNRLKFQGDIMSDVVKVITDYRSLVESYNNLAIEKHTLKENEITVKNDKLKVKAGEMAPSDLLQIQVTTESTRLAYVTQKNALQQTYQAFLGTLGLIPTAKIKLDTKISIEKTLIPTREQCIRLALQYNPGYQESLISLRADKRAVITAKNNLLPQLDLDVSVAAGATGTGAAQVNAGSGPSAAFTFSVPIDDVSAKGALLDDTIALEQAKIALEQQKEQLISDVIVALNNIHNQGDQVSIGKLQVRLQERNYQSFLLKQRYGKATALAVSQVQTDLRRQRINLIFDKIAYLNDVTALNELLGITLDKWHIQLRY